MKESHALGLFLENVQSKYRELYASNENIVADLAAEAHTVAAQVETFLQDSNFGSMEVLDGMDVMVPSIGLTKDSISCESVFEFVDGIKGLSSDYKVIATELIGIILDRHAAYKGKSFMAGQNKATNKVDNNHTFASLETLYPEFLTYDMSTALSNGQTSLESFGVGIDTALPDLKVSITVALMRFHTAVLERIMPTMPTSQPYAQYIKEKEFVIDTTTSKQTKILDLYSNPSIIDNTLKPIVPQYHNAPDKIVEDGIIRPNVSIDIIEASIVPGKVGYDKINITDKISDPVSVATVFVQLNDGVNPAEIFKLDVPGDQGRLSMMQNVMNDGNSGERIGDIRYSAFLTKGSVTKKGSESEILKICADGEGLGIKVTAKANANIITRICDCMLNFTVAAHNVVDDKLNTEALKSLVVTLNSPGNKEVIGYSLDAGFREDNFRKSDKLARLEKQPLAYAIPTAPNLFYDQAISQQNPETNSNNLAKIVSIGKDFRGINIAKDVLKIVHDARSAEAQNPLNDYDIGANYVAGDMVKPYVWMGEYSVKPTQTKEDADRSGDIKQKFVTYITYVIEQIHSFSKYVQQLPIGSKVTYRLLTCNPVLGCVIGQPHFHTALDDGTYGNPSGVEYKLTLPNGVILECVTTTFDIMKDKILIIPIVKNAPASNLNFAHNWNYGTIVGQYVQGSGGVQKRLFINSRELPIVVDPIGALITVTDLKQGNFIPVK